MSQISSKPGPQLQEVELSSLNLQQLSVLKQQLEQELGVLQDSVHTLKIAQNKFQDSAACLTKLTTDNMKGNEVMVPLTGSMYVTGKLVDTDNVLVDIGTGYYAAKGMEDAKDYFIRRMEYVSEQMQKIQKIGIEKSKMREATLDIMEKMVRCQMQEAMERASNA